MNPSATAPSADIRVKDAIQLYRAGDHQSAFQTLTEVLHCEPHHEMAWLWMSALVKEPAEQRYCLEQVLAANPHHTAALQALHSFPADLLSRNPVPAPQPEPVVCSFKGCSVVVSRPGHNLCYEHWKAKKGRGAASPATPKLSASQLGDRLSLSSQHMNIVLAELGWIERYEQGWTPTPLGEQQGAEQRMHAQRGTAYVVWPEAIMEQPTFVQAVAAMSHQAAPSTNSAASGFRGRFEALHRTTDGHMVRSKAEIVIDNWLYMSGLVHAYERRLPIEEEAYCDFYLPSGKVYIEYWGLEEDANYAARKRAKQDMYRKYRFNLVELNDEHVRNIDDVLPRMLLRFNVRVL